MYNFLVQAYSTYKGNFGWLTWISYSGNVLVSPIINVITYAILGRFAIGPEAASFYGLGIIISQTAFLVISSITQTYTYDRNRGTIAFLYVSPASRLVNFLSRAVFHFPNALIYIVIGMITLCLVTDLDFGLVNWVGFIVSLLIVVASMIAFSQFLGIFTIAFRDWINTMSLTTGIVFVFCGAIIPLDAFPPYVQEFAKILPVTNGLIAIRSAFAGAPLNEIYLLIIREFLTGLVYLMLGFAGFAIFEHVVKHTGTLDIETS